MPQIFHKAMNPVAKLVVIGLPMLFASTGLGLATFYRSSYATGIDEIVPQPVAFSHMHHVGQLGIDCRYCHTSVETSGFAGIPPTKTCMNCHQQIWQGAELLEPVRKSYKTDTPIVWNRVHNVPNYAYFNHSIHIAKGVGCQSCHGQIDQMALTFQSKTLLMEWCISCHRAPENHLRPKTEVFSMMYKPGLGEDHKPLPHGDPAGVAKWKIDDFFHDGLVPDPDKEGKMKQNELIGQPRPTSQAEIGKELKKAYNVRDAVTMTSCSMCHR